MILEKIRQVYPQLTRSQRKLADFIANSYQEAAFMTASRMARRLAVNEATVIRFAQRLGYPGYPELIHDVQALVQEELKAPGEAEAATWVKEPLLTSLEKEMEALQRAISHISPELAHQLLDLLRGARRIWVTGQGESFYLAGMLAMELAGLGREARMIAGDSQSLALALAEMGTNDVLVGVVASRENPELARAMRIARERGARTLAMTSSPIALSAQAANLALVCPVGESLPVPSLAAMAVLMDALVQALAGLDMPGTQQFGRTVDEALRHLRGGRRSA